jgi:hypothetical protein
VISATVLVAAPALGLGALVQTGYMGDRSDR